MGQGDGRSRRSVSRTPLESAELVAVSETLLLKESAATPQGDVKERARTGNAAIKNGAALWNESGGGIHETFPPIFRLKLEGQPA